MDSTQMSRNAMASKTRRRRLRCFFNLSAFQPRHVFAIFENEPRQLARTPETREKYARLREKAEEPAKIKTVDPIRNRNLVASQKSERRTDAMDRRAIPEILSQE